MVLFAILRAPHDAAYCIGRYSEVPLAVYAHQNKAVLMTQNGLKYDHKSAK